MQLERKSELKNVWINVVAPFQLKMRFDWLVVTEIVCRRAQKVPHFKDIRSTFCVDDTASAAVAVAAAVANATIATPNAATALLCSATEAAAVFLLICLRAPRF